MTRWQWFQPISFQIMWFSLILGGNAWLPVSIAVLGLHFLLTPTKLGDFKVLLLGLAGFFIDLCLLKLGFFSFTQWPLWLLFLWVAFILNLGHSMRFLRNFKAPYLIGLSALGGGYAYWASWKFGAVDLPQGPILTLAIVALIWGIYLPLCVKIDILMRQVRHE